MCRQSESYPASTHPAKSLRCDILLSSALLTNSSRVRDQRACSKSGNPRALGRPSFWFILAILTLAQNYPPPTTTGSALDRDRQRQTEVARLPCSGGGEMSRFVDRGIMTNIVAITRPTSLQLARPVGSRLHHGGRPKSQEFFSIGGGGARLRQIPSKTLKAEEFQTSPIQYRPSVTCPRTPTS